ncbi:MAG: citrate lyase subunit alpha [Melioribacteraceae bacterium]|nr:citrate lyase subunit alpha [Melioribacteraceae bacterium]MCF8353429.1 citrate lyase subunit alpha [Melioribacteraceae bacterium]MCF8393917.1 citrate lyase subunit alpha [Melioribacteraceae bacterium]MCF8418990.1 citrate lyase subunit alpha [Melioribacteraceae bacterium]
MKLIKNAAGRLVPGIVNNQKQIPFKGIGKHKPTGRKAKPMIKSCADFPEDGNKVVKNLKDALKKSGLKDGMTISTHHHLRNGDVVTNYLFDVIKSMGIKNIRWYPTASFPCHEHLIKYLDDGTIHHIEGSMNGPLGRYTSHGKMKGIGVLRSHGGRYQSIQDGEVHIDIAVIASPTADQFGNATGDRGPSACGLLGFALADSEYADNVIVVTDNLVEFPCYPWQIQGNNVDHVVKIDSLGDPAKIVSGTTQVTKSPDRLLIAEYVAQFLDESGIMKNGFSFQAGAGGTNLAFALYLKERMIKKNVKAKFIRGGSTKYLVEMLKEGLTEYILDGQTFDLDGVRSMRENPNHVNTSPFTSYNYHGKGNFASMVDAVVLGATEVDLNFNANVVTHSDGYLLHGIGGWQNCLFSKCTILAIPSFRDRIPVIVDEVTTLVGPGELIDVIVTERGIAINPKRKDLLKAVKGSGLPVKSINEIKKEIDDICGVPAKPKLNKDKVVAVIKWVDGTLLDSVFQVE